MTEQENNEYRNKSVINQRGATVEINNSTDREELKLSQYSGSNISLNNLVNSELATNNKQTKVINDNFESVGKDKNTFVGRDKVERVVENTYILRGFTNNTQLAATGEWKDAYRYIVDKNSQFLILRGGKSFPAGPKTGQSGTRANNPTRNQVRTVVRNNFSGYGIPPDKCVPIRDAQKDEVRDYTPVLDAPQNDGPLPPAQPAIPQFKDIYEGSGSNDTASNAPGVIDYGATVSAATEGGDWELNPAHDEIPGDLVDLQDSLNPIELKMGNGGDEINFVKRHKIETIGAATNTYPSIRVDPEGRSQPIGVDVGSTTSYENMDYIPHVEEIDNDMNFPVGNYTLNVGNRYNILVGSGGVQLKTSGSVEIGGTTAKIAANKVTIQASDGVHIGSENVVELQSKKSISLRSQRQVLVQPSLGVRNNLKVGGGAYIEGEVFVHHITAPVEVQETHGVKLFGKFNVGCDRQLKIGEALIDGCYYPVYALSAENLIQNYPHSHHFNNLPLRLGNSNDDVRELAMCENINRDDIMAYAIEQIHEFKKPLSATGPLDGCAAGVTPDCAAGEQTPPVCDPSDENSECAGITDDTGGPSEDSLTDLQSQLASAEASGDFTEAARIQELVNAHFPADQVGLA